jgi:hypothetical protein
MRDDSKWVWDTDAQITLAVLLVLLAVLIGGRL